MWDTFKKHRYRGCREERSSDSVPEDHATSNDEDMNCIDDSESLEASDHSPGK